MTEFLFPDNTVLCNFGAVDRLDLLRSVLAGRGRWTEAVAGEAEQSTRYVPSLSQVATQGWLGEPIAFDEADYVEVERIRRLVFGGTSQQQTRHLGEAQSIHLILTWNEFVGSWWISDDQESLRYARRQGITTCETLDLVKMAVSNGNIAADEAFDLTHRMRSRGRRFTMPTSAAELVRVRAG